MPFDAREFRLEILNSLVEAGSEEYKENVRISSLLEDKAQKTAGLAGVFLAAALAFIKVDTLSVWPFNRLRVLFALAAIIVLLVSCIGFCLAVMWLRAMPSRPTLESLNRLKSDLWPIPLADLAAYEEGYWGDRCGLWQVVTKEQSRLIKSKAHRLLTAHVILALATLVVALLLLLLIGPIICSHI